MARYYFHLHGEVSKPDRSGAELPGRDAVWTETISACRDFLEG
jgi:hypothetical protein